MCWSQGRPRESERRRRWSLPVPAATSVSISIATTRGAKRTFDRCREFGGEAELFKADVSDYGECERMFREFLDRFGGRIHVLVNNVGGAQVIPPGGFEDMPMEYWEAQIRFNLSAAACCARLAAKNMIDNRIEGKIINISSIHSRVTWVRRKMLPYGPAKAG
ncbi:MAG: SDR family NAD(P)-dependent oxidoreductase [Lentisphaeria bacterium]|nr:MAG: SDR family NAD(P)-dependent oxidoreductase [Lentisphaeria bacterium]